MHGRLLGLIEADDDFLVEEGLVLYCEGFGALVGLHEDNTGLPLTTLPLTPLPTTLPTNLLPLTHQHPLLYLSLRITHPRLRMHIIIHRLLHHLHDRLGHELCYFVFYFSVDVDFVGELEVFYCLVVFF